MFSFLSFYILVTKAEEVKWVNMIETFLSPLSYVCEHYILFWGMMPVISIGIYGMILAVVFSKRCTRHNQEDLMILLTKEAQCKNFARKYILINFNPKPRTYFTSVSTYPVFMVERCDISIFKSINDTR